MKWLPIGITLVIGAGLASLWRPAPKVGDVVIVPLAKLRGPEGATVSLPEGIAGSELAVRITEVAGSQLRGNPAGYIREGKVQFLPPVLPAGVPIQLLTFTSGDITGRADASGATRK